MRLATASIALLSTLTVVSAQAYWRNVPPPLDHYRDEYRSFKAKHLQAPIAMNPGPGPAVPADDSPSTAPEDLTISDILPRSRQINIFASLTRTTSIAGRLESSLASDNTTLLAPLNSAMKDLPRKPWEDRPGEQNVISAERDEDQAARNLERFVLEHVVPKSPWAKEDKVKTLGGSVVWWETREGGEDGKTERMVLMPGEVTVEGVLGRVGNGEVWGLRGVINYRE